MPIDLLPDRVIIQAAVTKTTHEKLWRWWIQGDPSRAAVVREALLWYLEVKPTLDEIATSVDETRETMRRILERLERGQE